MIYKDKSVPVAGGSARDRHLHGEQQQRCDGEDQPPIRLAGEAVEADADTAEGQELNERLPPVLPFEVDVLFSVVRGRGMLRSNCFCAPESVGSKTMSVPLNFLALSASPFDGSWQFEGL
jgi:hypothetical protein